MLLIPLSLWQGKHYRLLRIGLNLIILSLALLKAPALFLLLAEVAALLFSISHTSMR